MLYALKKRIAFPKSMDLCPSCLEPVRAKCGSINIWHWSHLADNNCDSWWEPESEWRLRWKSRHNPEDCEVPVGNHIADVLENNVVTLFQHSSISRDKIIERTDF